MKRAPKWFKQKQKNSLDCERQIELEGGDT